MWRVELLSGIHTLIWRDYCHGCKVITVFIISCTLSQAEIPFHHSHWTDFWMCVSNWYPCTFSELVCFTRFYKNDRRKCWPTDFKIFCLQLLNPLHTCTGTGTSNSCPDYKYAGLWLCVVYLGIKVGLDYYNHKPLNIFEGLTCTRKCSNLHLASFSQMFTIISVFS